MGEGRCNLHRHGSFLRQSDWPPLRVGHRICHRVLHWLQQETGDGNFPAIGQGRRGHQHHCRPRRGHALDDVADPVSRRGHPRRVSLCRSVRHRNRRRRHVGQHRHPTRRGRLRPCRRQRRRHRPNERAARGGPRPHRQPRRRGQHHRRHRQRLRDWLRRAHRPRAVRRLHGRGRHR